MSSSNRNLYRGHRRMLRALKNVLLMVPVAITAYDNIGYPAIVEGTSMQPTLNTFDDSRENEVVFINRFSTLGYEVHRNDIVAMMSPKDPSLRLVKRVIAIGGDIVRARRYKEPYVDIPEGYFWVEGDNMNCLSLDSNTFGPVSTGLVIGRATHVIWPPSRWRRLEKVDPLSRAPVGRKPIPHILSS